jgi:hypothetical protein
MRALTFFAVVLAATMSVGVRAETLGDPTQPMDFVFTGAGTGTGGSSARSGGSELQSTLVSPQRKSAVIGGRQVKIGDKYNGAVVADIKPYEVRLNRGGRETILRLSPKLAKEKGKVE